MHGIRISHPSQFSYSAGCADLVIHAKQVDSAGHPRRQQVSRAVTRTNPVGWLSFKGRNARIHAAESSRVLRAEGLEPTSALRIGALRESSTTTEALHDGQGAGVMRDASEMKVHLARAMAPARVH